MEKRVTFVGSIFFIASLLIVGRLFFWQVVKGKDLAEQAKLQQTYNRRTYANRGNILDRNGEWLAASGDKWLLFASLPEIEESSSKIASLISPIFMKETDEKKDLLEEENRIEELLDSDNLVWVPLKRRLSNPDKETVEDLDIRGLGFDREESRIYPEASSAAHLLGFVGKDDFGRNKGYFGLEGFYDFSLSGATGFSLSESDAQGNLLLFGQHNSLDAKKGVDLITHVDKAVQLIIEEKLSKGIEKYGAINGSVIVMNPKTGGIIGMAAFPSYDPEKYFEYGDEYFRNPIISDSYEPGSIFKPIVMAAGIDAGEVEPDTMCTICNQPLKVDKYFIRTWDNKYRENSTMTDVIKNSDNVGMAFVGQKLGADRLYDYLDKFGFGRNTGIDLQGEFSPRIRERGTWNIVDLATTTFGQGIAVTPMQMIKAISVIANDGIEVTPQVVDKFKLDDWEEDIEPEYGEQVISKEAADKITAMMVVAASQGEAKWAIPKGYKVAGKTGTAQIPVAGHYDEEKTIASFIGFAPPDDPEFAMLVTLREPETSPWASETAAPLWFNIVRDLFPYLGIKPS